MDGTVIRWINHAGYALRQGEQTLVVDPWLSGSVFDDGWDLLAPTVFSAEDWEAVTRIWFSHEHPDHFHPPSLRQIPSDACDRIGVLFQNTADHRVADWCRRFFASVQELDRADWVQLGPALEVRCVPHDNGDSWLAARTEAGLILNVNDCVISTAAECRRIVEMVGQPDVLLSQFSYANWVGNPDDPAARRKASEEKLSWLLTQIETLDPRVTVPFASYVWFSHEDNAHLNSEKASVAEVATRLQAAGAEVQVLYPGDEWAVGPTDAEVTNRAISRYEADLAAKLAGPSRPGETVPIADLMSTAETWAERLRAKNGRLLKVLPPARIHLWDHDAVLQLDHQGLGPSSVSTNRCDIRVRSDALSRALGQEYGGRTLDINGRFSVPSGGHYARFKAYATLAAFNARDESWSEIAGTVASRLMSRARQRVAELSPGG